jgi:hypothetical protein
MKGRNVFRFVPIMAALVLVGAWGIAGWAGVLLAIGSAGLYLAYDHKRSETRAATVRDSSEMFHSIAQRMSEISGTLESIREELHKEHEAEKEKERRRFWRKVEAQDSGGQGPIH